MHDNRVSLVNSIRQTVAQLRAAIDANRQDRTIIAFFCKDCDRMVMAAAQDSIDQDAANEIVSHLIRGDRLEKVNRETARKAFGGCHCRPQSVQP